MALITVLVPIYNVEAYIEACLKSLLAQDFKDFEVFAISDGSPANEKPIVEKYVKKDKRIKWFEKENGGYGSVLEFGLRQSSAPYILVCDPDDTLAPKALSSLYALIQKGDADIAIGAKTYVFADDSPPEYHKAYNDAFVTLKENQVYQRQDADFHDLFFCDASPHSKLYKRELALDLIFPHKMSYTDNILFYGCLNKARRVIYTSQSFAYYLVDRPGNTMTDLSIKALNQNITVFTKLVEQVKDPVDFFWYRMFDTYKYLLELFRKVKGSRDDLLDPATKLEHYLSLLLPHRNEILKYYPDYSKAGKREQAQDKLLLSKGFYKLIYRRNVNRILRQRRTVESSI